MKRVLTGLILAPLTLLAVLRAPPLIFAGLLAIVTVLAVREFYDLAESLHLQPYRWIGLAGTIVLVFAASTWGDVATETLLLIVLLLVLGRSLILPARMARAMAEAGITILGLLYPGLCLAMLGRIRAGIPGGEWWIVFLLLVVWLGDTAAYYVGRHLGRHPMAPQVSPKKTWEGAVASLLAAALTGGCLVAWAVPLSQGLTRIGLAAEPLGNNGGFVAAALLGMLVNIAAQAGDLVESVFKRGADVKDSGTLLPGHGGVLDRVDALLLATPVLWFVLFFGFMLHA